MSGMSHYWRLGMVAVLLITGFSACRKPADATASDLAEAGYQLTSEDWFRAARANDTAALKRFVQSGFQAETRDGSGDTALHAAAAAGAQGAADFMLNHGLGSNVRGAAERTPLMAAAAADQAAMVRWLVKQGADPRLKDAAGFSALMLAVRDGRSAAVGELAVVQGESLDPALLLAALTGQAAVIDTLTNYGASVYARMEDGRTPLMVAAQNGHKEAVALLLDIGASRFSTDASGQTAADLATAASHPDIAAMILREPTPADLTLDTAEQIALHLEPTATDEEKPNDINSGGDAVPVIPIDGQTLSAAVMPDASLSANPPVQGIAGGATGATGAADTASARSTSFAMPPIVMRRYREREMPVRLRTVSENTATLEILGPKPTEIQVKPGDAIPGSPLLLVSATRRMQDSKLNLGSPMEVSVVEVRDRHTGATREWISGEPATAHDPVAMVEDAATGRRYAATPGRRFKSADGAEFIVSDVRPNQIVIEDAATGATKTLPLRGPRG